MNMLYRTAMVLFTLVVLLPLSHSAITNASIIKHSDSTLSNMSWSSGVGYTDNAAGNPDITVQVCADNAAEVQNKYATFAYRAGNLTGFKIISLQVANEYTQLTDCAGSCCKGAASLDIIAGRASYPAYVYAILSDDTTIDESDTFIYVGEKSHLRGYYSTNTVESSYNSANGNITLQITGVQSWTGAAYQANSIDNPFFYLGVCEPDAGLHYWNCTGGYSGASRGTDYSIHTGVTTPPDSVKYTKYYTINGMGTSFCIGPDLQVTNVALNPSTQYSGSDVEVTITVRNNGNVDVTNPFNVTVALAGNDVQNLTVASLAKYTNSVLPPFTLSTSGLTSGSYVVQGRIVAPGIADCRPANNVSQSTLNINPAYYVRVFINGTESKIFPDAGRPYNVTLNVSNTDGDPAGGVTARIYEKNGISLFTPIQKISTGPNRGLATYTYGEALTNASGLVDFVVIPTGNKIYTQYAHLQYDEFVGNHSIYIEVFNTTTGAELQQTNGTALVDELELELLSLDFREPEPAELNTFTARDHSEFQILVQYMYNIFSTLSRWLVE